MIYVYCEFPHHSIITMNFNKIIDDANAFFIYLYPIIVLISIFFKLSVEFIVHEFKFLHFNLKIYLMIAKF